VATLKKYDILGKEVGEVTIDDTLLASNANGQMVKDYIVAIRRNLRQWSANTKGRSEINHSTQKPHRQKGLGRARQGSLSAPQYKGGGVVFGPKPKFDQHVRINKKERRAVNKFLISEKIKENRFFVLDSSTMKEAKTKATIKFLQELKIEGRRVLFITEKEKDLDKHTILVRSISNIQRAGLSSAKTLNGYDLIASAYIVLMDYAKNDLEETTLAVGKK
jgi:large subunit ribosomal protein L4